MPKGSFYFFVWLSFGCAHSPTRYPFASGVWLELGFFARPQPSGPSAGCVLKEVPQASSLARSAVKEASCLGRLTQELQGDLLLVRLV